MRSAPPLTPLHDALALLMAAWPARGATTRPVSEAAGLVAAETVAAPTHLPQAAVARRSGAAVSASDLIGASPYAPAMLTSAPPHVLPGDLLPPGTDAVVARDAVAAMAGLYEIGQATYPGEGAILPGADIAAGAVLVRAGETLSPATVLALRLAGIETLAVHELVIALSASDPDDHASPDIEWLRAMLRGAGCRLVEAGPADLRIVAARDLDGVRGPPDDDAQPPARLLPIALNATVEIVLDGGPAAPRLVVPPRFDALAGLFFGLLLPAVAERTGRRVKTMPRRLARKIVSQIGFTDIALLRAGGVDCEPLAVGRMTLSALLAANAAAILDPASEGAAAGSLLHVFTLDNPFETQ